MCGRFAMNKETHDLVEEFVLQGNDFRDWRPSYAIAPTQTIPIICERANADGEILRTVVPATWNFRLNKGKPLINARLETVAEKGIWKGAFASARCIVPMRGYYEFIGEPGAKIPHFIQGGTEQLAAAGLVAAVKVDDEWDLTAAIITRAARDALGEIHDRMPAFLSPDVNDAWLDPQKTEDPGHVEETLAMLEAVSTEEARTMRTHIAIGRSTTPAPPTRPTQPTSSLSTADQALSRRDPPR